MKKELEALKEINFWDKSPKFDFGYIRENYNSKIWKCLGNKLIKVVVGQRRAGKSVIVRQLMVKLIDVKQVSPKNILYLNKEMFEFEKINSADDLSNLISLYESIYKPEGKIYLIIDEVQNIENWEKLIVSLSQHPVKEYEIIITGSNSTLLSGELASLLSGRYIVIEVFPFSYREFIDKNNLENNKTNFIDYITKTGLPEQFNLSSQETKVYYFQALKNTILLKDIMYRYKIRDYVLLEDLFLFLIHNVGNLTSIPSIIKYYKSKKRTVDYSTISQYLLYMQEAFLIHEAQRMSTKTKELLAGEKKYYVNDLGFRNYLYPSLTKDIGSMLENIVYTHLKMSGYKINIMTGQNFEIDFIAEKELSKIYIQVSYVMETKETISREFGTLEMIKDNLPKYVVSMDDIILHNENGIFHKQVWDFIYELTE